MNHGLAVLHVTQAGGDVSGAPVYLFIPSGSYLGRSETTAGNGIAEFLLPNQQYEFRVDLNGSQYWSDVVTIIPFEENSIELNLDLLALDLTHDPKPVRYHDVARLYVTSAEKNEDSNKPTQYENGPKKILWANSS